MVLDKETFYRFQILIDSDCRDELITRQIKLLFEFVVSEYKIRCFQNIENNQCFTSNNHI